MVARLLLINPIETNPVKRGVKKMAKKRSAAQKRNDKRLGKMAKARHAGKKTHTPKKRKARKAHKKAKPVSAKTKAIKRSKRRKSENKNHHVAGYYPNPVRSHSMKKRKHYSRNPLAKMGVPSVKSIGSNMLMPAAIGAVGAVAMDAAWSYLPIPANIKTGNMKFAAKTVGVILLGVLASKVVKKSTAEAIVVGSLTVLFYGAARDLMSRALPMVSLGEMDMYSPGLLSGDDMGEYETSGMNEYQPAMGEYQMAGNGDNF